MNILELKYISCKNQNSYFIYNIVSDRNQAVSESISRGIYQLCGLDVILWC